MVWAYFENKRAALQLINRMVMELDCVLLLRDDSLLKGSRDQPLKSLIGRDL